MTNGIGRIKKVSKRVGDTSSDFEKKAEPYFDLMLGRLKRSTYTVRIIIGFVLVSIAGGWWFAS